MVVIAQKWPCWLSTVLTLDFHVVGAYFSTRFHHHFPVPEGRKVNSWSTVEDLSSSPPTLDNIVVLASGSLNFLMALEHLRPAALLFAVDVYFPRSSLRDCTQLYHSTAAWKIGGGYSSAIMCHADYGGATNAVHLVLMKGLDTPFTAPTTTLPRVLKHFVNTASRGGFREIRPPPPVSVAACAPIVVDGIGRINGLYDVCHPELEYAIPCVFKSSGWAQRRLTPPEWRALHDSPVSLRESLEADKAARSSIALVLSPLLVGWIIHTFWGSIGGGSGGGGGAAGHGPGLG